MRKILAIALAMTLLVIATGVLTLAEDVAGVVSSESGTITVNPEAFTEGELSGEGVFFKPTTNSDNGQVTVEVDPIHVTK
ncbi:hypothetical protein KGY79_08085 [Candidatus Bipolaricaulota bacterium]|nr:hypothetical protein [Candidatus Bipolaricaulota bacterium]